MLVGLVGYKAWATEQARRNPEAARIARHEKIFDVAWKTVDEKYYDPKFDHARWRALRDAYRPRIKDAPDDTVFYINVLTNLMNQAGTSHVSVVMPASAPVTASASPVKSRVSPLCFDWGFDFGEVRRAGSGLRVSDVRGGSNAERAGVAPDDWIESFEQTSHEGRCPTVEARLRTEGQAPRVVAFTMEDRPPPPSRQRTDLPSGVRVLRFDQFDQASLDWLGDNLPDASSKGLVLDLRRNRGGLSWVARKVAGQFLPPGAMTARMITHGRERPEKTAREKRRFEGPLVVLIGPASASAAEVTAAALRYHHRAVLIGGETAGAVLLSQAFPLPDGGQVMVAIADVLTPDGRRLEGVGVGPDLPVAQTLDAVRAGRDLPLEAAEKALLDGRWRP